MASKVKARDLRCGTVVLWRGYYDGARKPREVRGRPRNEPRARCSVRLPSSRCLRCLNSCSALYRVCQVAYNLMRHT